MPSKSNDTRLTHEQLRAVLTPSPGGERDEYFCPLCEHGHLRLFKDDEFDCKNDCDNKSVAKRLHELVGNGHRHVPKVMPKPSKQDNEEPEGELHDVEYAMEKCLDVHLLRDHHGVYEGKHPYYAKVKYAVAQPYFDENGKIVTTQWRWGMGSKNRKFLTKEYASKVFGSDGGSCLYGGHFLQRLNEMAKNGDPVKDIFLCEGESNPQTLTQNGFPAIGLPGVGNWKKEWADLPLFKEAKRIYFLLDMAEDGQPEAVAINGAKKIADSFPDGKVWSVRPPVKDISDLWIFHMTDDFGKGVEGFRSELRDALRDARPVNPIREVNGPNDWSIPQKIAGVERPKVDQFKPEFLPECLRPMCVDVAHRMSVPLDFTGIGLTVALASAVNRRAFVYPKKNDKIWKEPLNLWGGIIARPGMRKTPTTNSLFAPLTEVERSWMEENKQRMQEYNRELVDSEREKRSRKKRGEADFDVQKPEKPPQKRLIVNDATPEALHQVMSENPRGVLVLRDELAGWCAELEKAGRETQRTFYLTAWNGKEFFTLDRIERGSVGAFACLSMFGGVQPDILKEFMMKDNGKSLKDGLMQRLQLLVWPDDLKSKNVDQAPNLEAVSQVERVLKFLADTPEYKFHFHFNDDAQPVFDKWLDDLTVMIAEEPDSTKGSHFEKYSGLMPKLAALFQLADMSVPWSENMSNTNGLTAVDYTIDVQHTQQAIEFCAYLKTHALRIYHTKSTPQRAIEDLAGVVISEKFNLVDYPDGFTLRDVYKLGRALLTAETSQDAIDSLVAIGWLRLASDGTTSKGGRPTGRYICNPKLWLVTKESLLCG
ncbi:MAG TPA: YfjI family protein [Candidatus Acidoferrum sp.]